MQRFTGPDGKHYDLDHLPPFIVMQGRRIVFKADDVAAFTFFVHGGLLPHKIADWRVPDIAADHESFTNR